MNWPLEIGYRLLVFGLVAMIVGAFLAVAPVHFGPPPRYDPPEFVPFTVKVTSWHSGTTLLDGWITSNVTFDCPNVVLRIKSAGHYGYIPAGQVGPGAHVLWSDDVRGFDGKPLPMTDQPTVTAECPR